ncbi:DUF167 domain-containing protein [Candidatus Uhrbacteria bacterium]|nr:DUF167 domain-containing protein [Candidatus Uhrbacteria bacterium]
MKIFVQVKPGARETSIKKINETSYAVAVKERPQEGKANEAVIKALAGHFDMPKSRIDIVRGHSSSRKHVNIDMEYAKHGKEKN